MCRVEEAGGGLRLKALTYFLSWGLRESAGSREGGEFYYFFFQIDGFPYEQFCNGFV